MERDTASAAIPVIEATRTAVPPSWALWQRHLIRVIDEAGVAFVERYTRPDGTLVWRDDWPGMDGSDDAYESFYTFPLFYFLGGSEEIHALARKEWDAITWQFTEYGQIHREFDAYYDWMHHGESYLYLYFLGLADPYVLKDRQRTVRFARFYTGDDPDAPNYDPVHRIIRSPLNGSRGPRLEISAEDWSTHRDVLTQFPKPFEDIPGVTGPRANWNDDETFAHILRLMNERMARGDVPLNLLATSLVTQAFLYTGEDRYRQWVLDYLEAWASRARANGGIMPDNVGLTGRIGEYMEGKWWGGYYGWRWPHGVSNLLEAIVVAGANALLLTGDATHLDLARSQMDLLWSLRRREEGEWRVPHKHHDSGWTDFRPMSPTLPIQLWALSQSEEDLERVLRLPGQERWDGEVATRGGGWAPGAAWFRYQQGQLPEYPERALRASYAEVCRALEAIRRDTRDPKSVYIQHWIGLNPVICEALVQLTTGAPYPVYHGGLLHCRVCYLNPEARRPGLPPDVAALVEAVRPDGLRVHLANVSPQQARRVVLQAGAFAEHLFTSVSTDGSEGQTPVGSPWLEVVLAPGAGIVLDLAQQQFARQPRLLRPWGPASDISPIRLRTPDVDPGVIWFEAWD